MNIKEVTRAYLKQNEIDGLYNETHACCCSYADKSFMHCDGSRGFSCVIANKTVKKIIVFEPIEQG